MDKSKRNIWKGLRMIASLRENLMKLIMKVNARGNLSWEAIPNHWLKDWRMKQKVWNAEENVVKSFEQQAIDTRYEFRKKLPTSSRKCLTKCRKILKQTAKIV